MYWHSLMPKGISLFAFGIIEYFPSICMNKSYILLSQEPILLWEKSSWAINSKQILYFSVTGTYSALREIQLSKDLELPYYYMGYYIHSVSKMRYKGRFQPSDLLCPQHLSWHDINRCTPALDETKYATFENLPAVQVMVRIL